MESKYYKVPIAIVEIDDFSSIPDAVLSAVEGCIFCIDLDNVSSIMLENSLHIKLKKGKSIVRNKKKN